MDWAYVLPHRQDDCRVAMNSRFSPSSHPQDAKSGQFGRSIPQPRQTLNIGAALAQESAARAAFGQNPTVIPSEFPPQSGRAKLHGTIVVANSDLRDSYSR